MASPRVFDLLVLLAGALQIDSIHAFQTASISHHLSSHTTRTTALWAEENGTTSTQPPPILNGKRVFPYKIIQSGLSGHDKKIAAVFCVLGSNYVRGSKNNNEGWKEATAIGVTHDLATTLQTLQQADATQLRVAHVRALSFSFPQPSAMQQVASEWKATALEAGATLEEAWVDDVLNYLYENDEDDEEDEEDEEEMAMLADAMGRASAGGGDDATTTIISPFAKDASHSEINNDESALDFTQANVDKVLDEVRPYLIADGGNVSVERVSETPKKEIVLQLEGACGSCSSSTVTMQLGIEKVLREHFGTDVIVSQAEDDAQSQPKSLTIEAVETELSRLSPALSAMGCTIALEGVDTESGVVTIQFTGSQKVRQGLELALRDVDFVTDVVFV